jgi:hypothetical protein
MKRATMTAMFLVLTAGGLLAQQAATSDPYEGVSHPPADDTIVTTTEPEMKIAKPSAAHVVAAQPAGTQAEVQMVPPAMTSSLATRASGVDGTDAGIVEPQSQARAEAAAPQLSVRMPEADPDGDIVHPAPLPPGVVGEGTTIRVELMNDLSSNFSKAGEPFRSRVATDVLSWDGKQAR